MNLKKENKENNVEAQYSILLYVIRVKSWRHMSAGGREGVERVEKNLLLASCRCS
jgi:hypothetical protein